MTVAIRPLAPGDEAPLWAMLEPAFRAGDTYTVDPAITRRDALAFWCAPEKRVFIAQAEGPVGTYYLKPNQSGGGAHVCNCGFVTHPQARGQGVAQAMLDHALDTARAAGFRAMQFNFVVATNTGAIRIWRRAGFETVGRLPGAFQHPAEGYVDALVMYRDLTV
jgi:ribosomal protein S18 acetylase RimI-like enzyme